MDAGWAKISKGATFYLTNKKKNLRKNQLRRQPNCSIGRGFMRNLTPSIVVIACLTTLTVTSVRGAPCSASSSQFSYRDSAGKTQSVSVISKYYPKQIVQPFAKIDRRLDPKLMRAATLAEERANAHSKDRCWHYVKEALLASGVIGSYPKTAYAKEAGDELVRNYGFSRLSIRDPYAAPVGAVLVYGASRAAGHVEIRTKDGFVSDFRSKTPSPRQLIGVYAKS
jgi:hypothetical protein